MIIITECHSLNVQTQVESSVEKTLCCWLCTSGPISITSRTDRRGYCPGKLCVLWCVRCWWITTLWKLFFFLYMLLFRFTWHIATREMTAYSIYATWSYYMGIYSDIPNQICKEWKYQLLLQCTQLVMFTNCSELMRRRGKKKSTKHNRVCYTFMVFVRTTRSQSEQKTCTRPVT